MIQKVLGKLLAIMLFVSAYRLFDWNDWTQMAISTTLFLTAVNLTFEDAESKNLRDLGRTSLRTAAIIAVFVIVKLLVLG